MHFFYQIVLFVLIVFLYLHIRFQLKIVDDLEIYEIDYTDNDNLQNICDIRSPVIFNAPSPVKSLDTERFTKHQANHDVNIYDAHDNAAAGGMSAPVKLSFQAAHNMISMDKTSKYYSANNWDFLTETELRDKYEVADSVFVPHMNAQSYYDLILGSRNTYTPLSYHVDFRRFLYVSRGQITIKMTYWKSEKYLVHRKNWRDFVFYSPMNVWNVQPEYEENYEKIKFVEIVVPAGRVIYIPPYWWHSIKFTAQNTEIMGFYYRTYMNLIAIYPRLFMRSLLWNQGLVFPSSGAAEGGATAVQPPSGEKNKKNVSFSNNTEMKVAETGEIESSALYTDEELK